MKTKPILIAILFAGLTAAGPKAHAVIPPPDGGYPGGNTAEGQNALFSLSTGQFNTAVGFLSLRSNTVNGFNTAVGAGALLANTAQENTAVGAAALLLNTTGFYNTAVGSTALLNNIGGIKNTAVGESSLFSNTIGGNNTAVGGGALSSNTEGSENTAVGTSALASNTTAIFNTAVGSLALLSNTTGESNTATGAGALTFNTAGNENTAHGTGALNDNTGNGNTAIGFNALQQNTTGSFNVAVGHQALHFNTTGSFNIVLVGGSNLTTGDFNIDIGNNGEVGDANTIRIGNPLQNRTFIAGINGATASGGTAVYIDSNGQLGTMTSSSRFKDEIKPMGTASEAIHALKPVSFRYKKEIDPHGIPQFGLVAEEVEQVNPDLVIRDKDGKAFSVRYEQVNAMLLNEFLKEHKKNEEQQASIAELKSTIAHQQQLLETVTAELKKQAILIQQASVRFEVGKAAPQVACLSSIASGQHGKNR